jgi:hypothetical protein
MKNNNEGSTDADARSNLDRRDQMTNKISYVRSDENG